jgi:hypothetical protein
MVSIDPEDRYNLKRWCGGHRACFRRYWRWQSNAWGGRPRIEMELRALIRLMSTENQLGVRHVSTANCSSLALASLNQPSPSTW